MESRGRLRKFLLKKVGDFFSPPLLFRSFTALQFFSEPYFFLSCRAFTSISPFINLSFSFLLHSHSPSPPPLFSFFHPSLLLSLSISNCWPSVAQGRGREQAKLARTSTPLLPSGWDSFNAPLESSPICAHSSLHPSLFLDQTAAKKTGENLRNTSRANRNPKMENTPSF